MLEQEGGAAEQSVRPWLRPELFRPIPSSESDDYGYVPVREEGAGPLRAASSLTNLRRVVGARSGSPALLAWVPGDHFVRTIYEIEELAETVDLRSIAEARSALQRAVPRALIAALLTVAAILFWPEDRQLQMMLLIGSLFLFGSLWSEGVMALLDATSDLRLLRSDPVRWRRRRAERIRFEVWSGEGESVTALGLVVVAILMAVLTMMAGKEEAFDALALVKDRTRAGEYWRLFTCMLLHANALHIYFNLLVAVTLAQRATRLVSESRVLLTFLVAGIAGSVTSLMLSDATSVGASGGILGWGGLLAGLGLAHPDIRRTGIVGQMLRWVLILALMGVVGASFIDNGAHAGGFVAGLLLGLLFGRRGRTQPLPLGGSGIGRPFEVLAALALAGALWMVVVLVRLIA